MGKFKIKNQKSKIQFKIKNLEFCIVILIFAFYIFNFIGCATIIEGAKGFAGMSTKVIEDNRKDAIKKTFNHDYNACYNKAKETLEVIGAYIYAENKNKNLIAVYVSEEDTTPVGLFFKSIDSSSTQVEVSSPSTYAKELIAKKIFFGLEDFSNIEKLKIISEKEKEEAQAK